MMATKLLRRGRYIKIIRYSFKFILIGNIPVKLSKQFKYCHRQYINNNYIFLNKYLVKKS